MFETEKEAIEEFEEYERQISRGMRSYTNGELLQSYLSLGAAAKTLLTAVKHEVRVANRLADGLADEIDKNKQLTKKLDDFDPESYCEGV